MGIPSSKLREGTSNDELREGNHPSTPILTITPRVLDNDPRSPTSNISRTPIEVLQTPVDSLQKNVDETDTLHVIADDPRSPSLDFTRTPIVIDALKTSPLRNKHLDKARRPVFNFTPVKIKRNSEKIEQESNTLKLLENGPILSNRRNSVVGLLETNLDFVETDLDTVAFKNQEKQLAINDDEGIDTPEETENLDIFAKEKSITVESKSDTAEVAVGCCDIDVICEHKIDEMEFSLQVCDISGDGNAKSEKDNKLLEKNVENQAEINCIVPELTGSTSLVCKTWTPKKIATYTKTTDLSSPSIEEFDKKLTNLIYEDASLDNMNKVTHKTGKLPLPLGVINPNEMKRAIPKLKVSDKPTKYRPVLSKIPVFKERKGKNVQCENTPPMRNSDGRSHPKPKTSQWGAEDSLVI